MNFIRQDLTTFPLKRLTVQNYCKKVRRQKNQRKKYHKHTKELKKPRGFLTDLAVKLGLDLDDRGSHYGKFVDSNGNEFSIRVANHNADTSNYKLYGNPQTNNIGIVIKSRRRKNTFIPDDDVTAREYVYFKEDIAKADGDVLSQIAESISEVFDTGVFVDKTGLAKENVSPKTPETSSTAGDVGVSGDAVSVNKGQPLFSITPEVNNARDQATQARDEMRQRRQEREQRTRDLARQLAEDRFLNDGSTLTATDTNAVLRYLRGAARDQRGYDIDTAKVITGLAKAMQKAGLFNGLTDHEVSMTLTAIVVPNHGALMAKCWAMLRGMGTQHRGSRTGVRLYRNRLASRRV